MSKSYVERIKDAGVVGAGGAGFPTHIKVNNKADIIIANGAECEPLLRVDQQIMENFPDEIVKGLQIVMRINNAKKGVICLKKKYHLAIEKINKAIGNKKNISIHLLDNYYPAGDEQQLIYEVTEKVLPVGALPIEVGTVVNNVSTLVNISDAILGIPVTNKFVTIAGEVSNPVTLNAPIGTPVSNLLEIADAPMDKSQYTLIAGGPSMGNFIVPF